MPERNCLNHKDRPAIGQCNLCHKPICEACRYAAPAQGLFCGAECYDKFVAYQGRRQPVVRSSPLKSLVVGLLILAALAAGAVVIGGGMLRLPVLRTVYDAVMPRGGG